MPSRSRAQQSAAGMALAAKRERLSPEKLLGASRGMYESMSEKQLDDFASTKRSGLPEHKDSDMRGRHKSRGGSASPDTAEKAVAAESKKGSSGFKRGGAAKKAGGYADGGAPAGRMDKAPRKKAGGSVTSLRGRSPLSSAAKLDTGRSGAAATKADH